MTNRTGVLGCALAAGAIASFHPGAVLADRSPPQELAPVVYEGTRYEVPHVNNVCGQNGGCVVAYDNATGEQLWHVKVYCTSYKAELERDVQDVFITELHPENGKLIVKNERGLDFVIDITTRGVRGDGDECSGAAPASVSGTPAAGSIGDDEIPPAVRDQASSGCGVTGSVPLNITSTLSLLGPFLLAWRRRQGQ